MKKILLLGSGLSATSLIKYLLNKSAEYNWKVIIGDIDVEIIKKKIDGHPNGTALKFDVFDEKQRLSEIKSSDVVISMLPARFHNLVAQDCVETGTNMVTASYVSEEMKALDKDAKKKGVALLNELGVDPGIDHMSAMKVIDEIKAKGGKILSFKSSTGGLVAPEYDNNPWNYKFTWNPRNVVLAGQGAAMFIRNGWYKYIPYNQLFNRILQTSVLDMGEFEIYPNRDSLSYREVYGLEDIPTMFRGTLRRPGFCEAWNVFVQLGATDDTYVIENSETLTYRKFINSFLKYHPTMLAEEKLIKYLNISEQCVLMEKLAWLGIFEEKVIGIKRATPAKILQNLLEKKWALEPGDKDMIVMQHDFEYELNGQKKGIRSSLVVKGEDTMNTAMSITVGTPVAIATKLLLTDKINVTGVHRPVTQNLYMPILEELEEYGIKFIDEEFTPEQ